MRNNDDIKQLIKELKQLKIREAQLLARIEAAADDAPIVPNAATAEFAPGDRVRIRNQVNRPRNWPDDADWIQEEAQIATVSEIVNGRVFFNTDNGIRTWRLPQNLERIED